MLPATEYSSLHCRLLSSPVQYGVMWNETSQQWLSCGWFI